MNTGTLTVLFAEVEFVTTIGLNMNPCRACYACWFKTSGKCVQKDDATEVIEKIRQADQAFVKTVNGIFEGMMKKQ